MTELVEKLYRTSDLTDEELKSLIEADSEDVAELLRKRADEVRRLHYGRKVFLRGLIEVSSYCKNDCLYCGIRRSNKSADRYRLTREQIMLCAESGYELGFRTFVMQGGEDSAFTDDFICGVISELREKYPDCAITLSLGERSTRRSSASPTASSASLTCASSAIRSERASWSELRTRPPTTSSRTCAFYRSSARR